MFVIDGGTDSNFLERVFQKLLLNFTWWLNRQDPDGNNLFGGGFLGLDNISPIDRSHLPPGLRLDQADGTAWMAYYSMAMLTLAVTLAEHDEVYEDMVVKFLEQTVLIMDALEDSGCYDPVDGFFYDQLTDPSGTSDPDQGADPGRGDPGAARGGDPDPVTRTGSGGCGSGSPAGWSRRTGTRSWTGGSAAPANSRRTAAVRRSRRTSSSGCSAPCSTRTRSCPRTACGRCPSGTAPPTRCPGCPTRPSSTNRPNRSTAMYGGNSNWRGPVWFPVNYLVIRALLQYDQFFGPDFTIEYPTGSGATLTLREIAGDLADRLVSIWLPGPDGRRPVYGGVDQLQTDPAWKDNLLFFEYFHGDNGAGLGAMHQTGWTALVADLILDPPRQSTGWCSRTTRTPAPRQDRRKRNREPMSKETKATARGRRATNGGRAARTGWQPRPDRRACRHRWPTRSSMRSTHGHGSNQSAWKKDKPIKSGLRPATVLG